MFNMAQLWIASRQSGGFEVSSIPKREKYQRKRVMCPRVGPTRAATWAEVAERGTTEVVPVRAKCPGLSRCCSHMDDVEPICKMPQSRALFGALLGSKMAPIPRLGTFGAGRFESYQIISYQIHVYIYIYIYTYIFVYICIIYI